MRTHLLGSLLTLALVALLPGCSVEGETCGLGRCDVGYTCKTVFEGDFDNKAFTPGTDVENLYWCIGTCPAEKACTTECMHLPQAIDDKVCVTNKVEFAVDCPSPMGAEIDGVCKTFPIQGCTVGGKVCTPNSSCSLGKVPSGTVIGPLLIDTGTNQPLTIELANFAHSKTPNPPLAAQLPEDVTVTLHFQKSCE